MHVVPMFLLAVIFTLSLGISASAKVTKEEALNLAKKQVPSCCKVTEVSYDEETHQWECEFLTKRKKAEYEIRVDEETGKIVKIEMEKQCDKGGRCVRISKKKAKKAVMKKFKDATVTKVKLCRDDGFLIFRVSFYGNGYTGNAEVNARTGKINEWTQLF